jgi:hypothetical protein
LTGPSMLSKVSNHQRLPKSLAWQISTERW